MQAAGVIGRYAIGGAVGATFYVEAFATEDLDIFVDLPPADTSLVSLGPIYDYLRARGYHGEREHIRVEGWPVQFLVPNNTLQRDALDEAIEINVEGVRTLVMQAEHLAAIALQTGRAKDYARIALMIQQYGLDSSKLDSILKNHGLADKWQNAKSRFS